MDQNGIPSAFCPFRAVLVSGTSSRRDRDQRHPEHRGFQVVSWGAHLWADVVVGASLSAFLFLLRVACAVAFNVMDLAVRCVYTCRFCSFIGLEKRVRT